MTNKEVAAILEEIGILLELGGENPFKCRAYQNGARIVGALRNELADLVKDGRLREVKGIGEGLAAKITELIETGKLQYYDDLKASFPPGLVEMLRIQGLGPKRIKILFDKLKITTIDELNDAARGHRLTSIPGFGAKTEQNILSGIEHLRRHEHQHLFSTAKEAADSLVAHIHDQRGVRSVDVAGSLRRRKEIIGDIDILASAQRKDADSIMSSFTSHSTVEKVIARGETKSSVILKTGINSDLRIVDEVEYPFALIYFTGSKEHNVALRSIARDHGWSLNEYGFSRLESEEKRGKAKRLVQCTNEEEIYKSLGLCYIPPELRENLGEIEAAQKDRIPVLVGEDDLKGTFHCHTTYSDGLNSIEEMAEAARQRGWKYLGIADHSKVAAYAGGLSAERVKQQHREIDRLNSSYSNFRIFKGTEVDILADGRLDWSDGILASFDFVVASVHSRFNMSESEATKRIIAALKNRYVTMLGHPTGRLLLGREGYPLNMFDVISAAADYGKIIEINANPHRLDLDWRWCRLAKEKGVKISINPDAHNIHGLGDVQYGVGIARKGWLEKDDVVNTYSLDRIIKLLKH